ncbi:hypothetical protein [Nitratifractor sp.]
MTELFHNYAHLIVFLHVLGAFVWVGGMIAVRVAVHPVMQSIDDPKIKLGKTLEITGRLFNLVMPFIAIILATGLIMAIALGGHHGAQKALFLAKETIWTVMTINYAYMYFKRAKAWKLFGVGDLPAAKALVANIPNLLLPINIVLGVTALWLGVSLRGLG